MTESTVRALLKDRPIAYKPILAKALGGVTVGLWMSQLMYWSDKGADQDGWIYKTQEEWAEETAMGLYEVAGARDRALELGVVEKKLARVPATLHYRICWERLEQVIDDYVQAHPSPSDPSSFGKNPKLDLGKTQNKIEEKPKTITETTPQNTQRMMTPEKDFPASPADFGAVQRTWEQSAGLLSKTTADLLGDLCDEYGPSMVHEALMETVKQIGRPKIKYLEAVLQNWRDRGQDKRPLKGPESLQQIAPGVWRQ